MPQDDGARALWALVTRGTLGTVEVARVLGRDDDRGRRRARDLLKRLAAHRRVWAPTKLG